MQDHIASAFDDWFLLQICLRESLPWCLRKESGFSAWDDRILDSTLTRSTVFCSAKKLLPERRLRRPERSLLQVHVASTWCTILTPPSICLDAIIRRGMHTGVKSSTKLVERCDHSLSVQPPFVDACRLGEGNVPSMPWSSCVWAWAIQHI